jgi:hypothetical protein
MEFYILYILHIFCVMMLVMVSEVAIPISQRICAVKLNSCALDSLLWSNLFVDYHFYKAEKFWNTVCQGFRMEYLVIPVSF